MKTSSLLTATAATAALAFAPTAAFGFEYPEPGEGTIVVDQTPEDCQFPVTVEVDSSTSTVTLTVTDSSGAVVYQVTKSNDGSNSVDFNVDLGENCDGSYTLTATDQDNNVLSTSNIVVDEGSSPTDGGGTDDGDTVAGGDSGGLPATGSSDAMLVSGLAGAGLLAAGSVLLVRRRRATA